MLGLEDGVESLEFIPDDVAVPPFPAWSASDHLLVSVATLQRRLHEAVADFRPAPDAVWGGQAPPRDYRGTLVCHNDICLENVVVRDDRAAAFIDFDLARPVDRLWDIAIALRHWVPMRDPQDVDEHRAGSDQVERCRMFLAAHGLDARERERTVAAVLAFLDEALEFVRAQAEAGHSGHAAVWNAGYADQNRRSHRWVGGNRHDLARSA
jgi:aminoglycoside phosphotransferase (APT) family kinase protein